MNETNLVGPSKRLKSNQSCLEMNNLHPSNVFKSPQCTPIGLKNLSLIRNFTFLRELKRMRFYNCFTKTTSTYGKFLE